MARFAGQIPPIPTSARMKCMRCGKWLPVTAAFCRRCGIRTAVPLPTRVAVPVAPTLPRAMPTALPPRAVLPRPDQIAAARNGGVVLPYEPQRPRPPREPFGATFFQPRVRSSRPPKGSWLLIVIAFFAVRTLTGISHWTSPSAVPPTRWQRPPRVTLPATPPPFQPRGVYSPTPVYAPPPVHSPNYPPGTSAPQNTYPPYPHRPGSSAQPPYGSPNSPSAAPAGPDGGPAGRLIPGTSYYIDSHGRVVNPAQPGALAPGAVAPGAPTPSASRGH